jgi:hypothetical protein
LSHRSADDSKHRHGHHRPTVCTRPSWRGGDLQCSLHDVNVCVPRHHLTPCRRRQAAPTTRQPRATTSIEVPARGLPRAAVYGAFAMDLRVLAVTGCHAKIECLDSDAQLIAAADNRIDAACVNKDAIRSNIFPGWWKPRGQYDHLSRTHINSPISSRGVLPFRKSCSPRKHDDPSQTGHRPRSTAIRMQAIPLTLSSVLMIPREQFDDRGTWESRFFRNRHQVNVSLAEKRWLARCRQ